jgi:hypothetical protein
MKRIFAFFLVCCLLAFSGCSAGQKQISPKDLNFDFSCQADVTTPNGNYTCAIERAGLNSVSVEIISGSGAGLKWYWNGDGFRQTYKGLTDESQTCDLPENSFASVIVKILDWAQQSNALESVGDNVFRGNVEGASFAITADGDTGNITQLTVSDLNLTAAFHDFTQPAFETAFTESYQ